MLRVEKKDGQKVGDLIFNIGNYIMKVSQARLKKIIKEEVGAFLSEEGSTGKVDRQFLRKYVFELPRRSDEEQIIKAATRASNSARKYGHPQHGKLLPLYGYNQGNYSIALPDGDGYVVYVSYGDHRDKKAQTDLKYDAFTSELGEELRSMGFEKHDGMPAPMSGDNLQAHNY